MIEDDPSYAWLVEEMLRESFRGEDLVVEAFDAVESATAEPRVVDCALVDLSLPDRKGIDVIDAVLASLPDVPLVVITGAEDEALALQAVERGAQDYLVKRRVDPEVLGRSVRYAIERKRSEGQRAELLLARAAHAEAEALSGILRRLQDLADAAIPVEGTVDRAELLDRSLAVVSADAGALIVEGPYGLRIAAARALDELPGGNALAQSPLLQRLLTASEPVTVETDTDDPSLPGIRSVLATPLNADNRRVGLLLAASPVAGRFSDEQARLLALAGERVARALANADAYERERRTAAALQAGLLPHGIPLLQHGELAARYVPTAGGPGLGGDWYDAIALPDGRIALVVGEVAGSGPAVAVRMAQLRTALRAYALEGSGPGLVVARLNALALTLADDAPATLVYAVLDQDLTRGRIVNAGHAPPIQVTQDGAHVLDLPDSPAVGIGPNVDFEEREVVLTPGDALCLMSGPRMDSSAVARALGTPAAAEVLAERALGALEPGHEDVALLVLQTRESAGALRTSHPAAAEELGPLRERLRAWLEAIGANRAEVGEIQLAANEACMNVIEHAYEGREPGVFEVEGHLDGRTVVLLVRDAGRWSEVRARERGRGLKLMEAVMDSVQLSFSANGTVVVLRRQLEALAA